MPTRKGNRLGHGGGTGRLCPDVCAGRRRRSRPEGRPQSDRIPRQAGHTPRGPGVGGAEVHAGYPGLGARDLGIPGGVPDHRPTEVSRAGPVLGQDRVPLRLPVAGTGRQVNGILHDSRLRRDLLHRFVVWPAGPVVRAGSRVLVDPAGRIRPELSVAGIGTGHHGQLDPPDAQRVEEVSRHVHRQHRHD